MDNAQILEAIEKMPVLQLSQLIKEMEEKFGVSAAEEQLLNTFQDLEWR